MADEPAAQPQDYIAPEVVPMPVRMTATPVSVVTLKPAIGAALIIRDHAQLVAKELGQVDESNLVHATAQRLQARFEHICNEALSVLEELEMVGVR
jgi:hypothetical protein